jgi:nucleoside phosphorylase
LLQAIPGSVHGEIAGADAPIADASEKIRLHTLTGAMAVDMESHVAAKVAALHNIPFVARLLTRRAGTCRRLP